MRSTLIAIVILALTVGVSAQSSSHRRRRRAPAPPPTPQIPSAKQVDEMKKLVDTFAGMWKTTATVEKNMFFSEAGTSQGHSEFRAGPAGNSLEERARSHGVLGTFAGNGIIWWDAKSSAYSAIWCDSLSRNGCDMVGTGKWDGNNLVFTSETDMGGNKLKMREIYSDITHNSFTFTMQAAVGEAPMAKMMTIQYERSQPTSDATPPTAPASQASDPEAPKQ